MKLLTLFAVGLLCVQPLVLRAQADNFKVTTDRTVDNSSLESIIADVYRLSGAKTNDEKAIAIHDYLHRTIFHLNYATEPQNKDGVGPLKVINAYGWGLCGGQHTVLKSLFETAGWQVRYVGWPGHTTIEVNYDNKWHYFDTFLKCYFWMKDKSRVAGQEDIANDPSIALDGQKDGRTPVDLLVCGDDAPGVVAGCKARTPNAPSQHEDGWASVTGRDHGYDSTVHLPSGATLSLLWAGEPDQFYWPNGQGKQNPVHTCGNKDFRSSKILGPIMEHYGPRGWADGHLDYKPDFSKAGDVADIKLTGLKAESGKLVGKGSAVFSLISAYVYTSMKVDQQGGTVSVSVDGGKNFKPANSADLTDLVKGWYNVVLKVDVADKLDSFKVAAVVEHNKSAQPYLFNGKNVVTISAANKDLLARNNLTVIYSYQEATGKAPETRDSFRGNEVKYSETKTVETKITSLPCNFTIDVGGTEPPKMIALTRVVSSK
ncbi:MAG TPA: hypothetical protein VL860_10605 [Planctomycetota bacterium]|nr:hypothetical protein [Planctomycetota bacterium]